MVIGRHYAIFTLMGTAKSAETISLSVQDAGSGSG
jgi:hypothetical protein